LLDVGDVRASQVLLSAAVVTMASVAYLTPVVRDAD
jgi:hypothetical protein